MYQALLPRFLSFGRYISWACIYSFCRLPVGIDAAKRCTNARLRDRAQSRKDGETLSQGQVQGLCPWLRVSPSFRLLRAITKSCVSTTFRGVYANGQPCLCRRNLTSVTCQNVPGPPPAFPIVWEVGPGNEATACYSHARRINMIPIFTD